MSSPQVASFPFASADMTKVWVGFKLPSPNMEALLEAHRKNAAALTNASQMAFDGLKALAQLQGDLIKTTIDDYGKVTSDILAAASLEEKTTKQADAARHIYTSAVDRFRELADTAVKANVAAADILNARVTEAFDEFKALFTAPVAAEPATVVEEVIPVEDAVALVEPEPTVTAAPTAVPKAPAPAPKAPKAGRRPTSRG